MKKSSLSLWSTLLLLLVFEPAWSQETLQPTVKSPVFFDRTPSLREMRMIGPELNMKTAGMPNKFGHRKVHNSTPDSFLPSGDPVWQKQNGSFIPLHGNIVQNFEGMPNLSLVNVPDPQGDVGPDHYVQVVNSSFTVFSKTGSILYGPASLGTIWQGFPEPWSTNAACDPIVLYDQAADRWIISQLSYDPVFSFQNGEMVAVSQTPDPTGPWYRYVYDFGSVLPDYPKFGIWPDGYYMSCNQFEALQYFKGVGAMALDRTKMLTGDSTARMVFFDLGENSDPYSMLPSDWDGPVHPPAGEPNYFTYFNDWSSPTEDYLKVWQFSVNWTNPAASTFSPAYSLVTAPFESMVCPDSTTKCISQPGTELKLMAISDRLMYRLQYRNFGAYRSMVTNHTVNADGNGHAGIRWYELRNGGSGWSIFQQGTYAPDSSHRWVGSIAMNDQGDITLGYSVGNGSSLFPSIRYTGRKTGDPPGQMTLAEQTIMTGTGCQPETNYRWGDYSMMSVDPNDDQTFWFTSEYLEVTGDNNWQTRIASVKKLNGSPDVLTVAASNVSPATATLNGTVNPNGLATTWHFEWGTTPAYGNSTPVVQAGSGTTVLNVSAGITGLSVGVTCYFRLVGTNSAGTSAGRNRSFTPGVALVTTRIPSEVGRESATAGGNVVSDGGFQVLARGVCWGLTANPSIDGGHTSDGTGTGAYTTLLNGLIPDTVYHVRAYVTTTFGTYYGNDLMFRTLCGVTVLPLSESFNSTSLPFCWKEQLLGDATENTWFVSPSALAGGSANEMVSVGILSMDGTTRLVMIPVNTIGMSQLNLSFKYLADSWFFGARLKVQSSVDGQNWTDESWYLDLDGSVVGPETVNATITHNLNSPTTYIGFAAVGALIVYNYWYLDDISVEGVCSNVTGLPWEENFLKPANMPACWTQVDHQGDGQDWDFGKISQQSPLPALAGNYAFLNSRGYGAGSDQNADLITPVINLSASPYARLRFYHYFKESPGSSGTVSYSKDNGASWTSVEQFTTISATNPALYDQIFPELGGYSQVRFKWNYTGSNGYSWAIDSIRVSAVPDALNLQNQVIGATTCYDAYEQIITGGNGSSWSVLPGGHVTMLAGSGILMLPSTRVFSGGYLLGIISPSGPWCGSLPIPATPGAVSSSHEDEKDKMSTTGSPVRIFPNPIDQAFRIEFTGTGDGRPVMADIFNQYGQRVSTFTVSGKGTHLVVFEGNPAGVYLLRLTTGNQADVFKLIKR